MSGPASALSAKVIFPKAATNGTDVVVNVDRATDPAAYTATYAVGQSIVHDAKDFVVTFYSSAAQVGSVVASGTATITWDASDANLGSIAVDKKVSSVSVVDPGALYANTPIRQLDFVAKDASGTALALTPGAASWSVTSGSESLTVTSDGKANAIAAGPASVVVAVDGISSSAQPISVSLEPIGFFDFASNVFGTTANSISGGMVAGRDTLNHPAWWSSTTGTRFDLSLSGSSSGEVYGIDAGHFAGVLGNHAALWTSPESAPVDLSPAQADSSIAQGVSGNFVVGSAFPTNETGYHAALWQGTSASYVDLNPAGYYFSQAFAADGTAQAGYTKVSVASYRHAALWNGTANSFVDLNPADALESVAYAASGGVQGGHSSVSQRHATLWHGTAASAVDINPVGHTSSMVLGIRGNFAVGIIDNKAAIWNVSTKSYLLLETDGAVPYDSSSANALEVVSTGVDVVGKFVSSLNLSPQHGVIWHIPASRLP